MSFAAYGPRPETCRYNRRRMPCEQLVFFPAVRPASTLGDTGNPATAPRPGVRHRRPRLDQPCFPGKVWQPKPRPHRRKPPTAKPVTKPVSPRKQRERFRYQQLIEGWTTDPTWVDSKACTQPGAPLMISMKRADIKAARACCDSCIVRLDCLHAQHSTHPRARAAGVVAGFVWMWERNHKRIVLASPEELKGWCPMCYQTFPPGRPATIHTQRCAERYVSQILGN